MIQKMMTIALIACTFSMTYAANQDQAVESIYLDAKNHKYSLSKRSTYRVLADNSVGIVLKWHRETACTISRTLGAAVVHPAPECPNAYRKVLAKVAGLQAVGNEVLYVDNGESVVCARFETHTSWFRKQVTKFYSTGNCRLETKRVGNRREASLTVL